MRTLTPEAHVSTEHLCLRLYGMAMHQLYRYNHLYPKDGLWLKALVRILALAMLRSGVTLTVVI